MKTSKTEKIIHADLTVEFAEYLIRIDSKIPERDADKPI
jgi:hypothetical protein